MVGFLRQWIDYGTRNKFPEILGLKSSYYSGSGPILNGHRSAPLRVLGLSFVPKLSAMLILIKPQYDMYETVIICICTM